MQDTRVPLVFAFISFWIFGFWSSYGLAFTANMGAAGIWIGLTLGLMLYAGLLVWRFVLLMRPAKREWAQLNFPATKDLEAIEFR